LDLTDREQLVEYTKVTYAVLRGTLRKVLKQLHWTDSVEEYFLQDCLQMSEAYEIIAEAEEDAAEAEESWPTTWFPLKWIRKFLDKKTKYPEFDFDRVDQVS
jgi:hypothetical protein